MKKKTEKIYLVEQYSKAWKYVKLSKNFILAMVVLFFLAALIAFIFPTPDRVTNAILKLFLEILEKTEGMNVLELTIFIFLNNLQASFFGVILGFFLGVFPILFAIFNGYLIGFVSSLSIAERGFFSLWALLPHGIFELPAIWISLGLGLKFGSFIFQKKKIESFKDYFYNSLRVFALIVIPLLIIAAVVEGVLIALLGN